MGGERARRNSKHVALACTAADARRSLACFSIESRRHLVVDFDGPLLSRDAGDRPFRDTLWVTDASDLDHLCRRNGFPPSRLEQERMEAPSQLALTQCRRVFRVFFKALFVPATKPIPEQIGRKLPKSRWFYK